MLVAGGFVLNPKLEIDRVEYMYVERVMQYSDGEYDVQLNYNAQIKYKANNCSILSVCVHHSPVSSMGKTLLTSMESTFLSLVSSLGFYISLL